MNPNDILNFADTMHDVIEGALDIVEKRLIDQVVKEYKTTEDKARMFLNITPSTDPHKLTDDEIDVAYHFFLFDVERAGYVAVIANMYRGEWNHKTIQRFMRMGIHDGEFSL